MTRGIGLALLAAAIASAPAPSPAPTPPTLAIYALSRGKGVPEPTRAALTRIRVHLEAARKDQRVKAMKTTRIGLEGETRLCVAFRDAASAATISKQVRKLARNVDLLNVVDEPCRYEEKKR